MAHEPKNYKTDGGDTWVVTGKLDVSDGEIEGVDGGSGERGPEGPEGPQGPPGEDGEQGPAGADGATDAEALSLSSVEGLDAENVQDAITELVGMINGGDDE